MLLPLLLAAGVALPAATLVPPDAPAPEPAGAMGAPPIAIADHFVVHLDQVLSVPAVSGLLNNDHDPEGQPLVVYTYNATGMTGSVSVFSDGRFNYTPAQEGLDSFRYRMRDDESLQSEYAEVSIEVLPPLQRAPQCLPDQFSVAEAGTLVVATPGVLGNDLDPEGDALTVFTYNNTGMQGSMAMFSNGRFNYTPPAGFTGIESFTYRMRDSANNQSATCEVQLHVVAVDRGPTARDDAWYLPVDGSLSVSDPARGLLSNDSDPDGDAMTVISYTAPPEGSVSIFANGRFSYTAPPKQAGTFAGSYRMRSGGKTALATIYFFVGQYGGIPTGAITPPHLSETKLEAFVPNPFNPRTRSSFELPQAGRVELRIYDMRGRVVRTLLQDEMPAGSHTVEWNGRSEDGQRVASGTYVVELRAAGERTARKVTLLQ